MKKIKDKLTTLARKRVEALESKRMKANFPSISLMT